MTPMTELSKFDLKYMEARTKSKILVDDKTAIMTQKEFDDLPEYSCSMPTGVFIGKRWKRDDNANARYHGKGNLLPEWIMGEYGESDKPNMCKNIWRKIYVIDAIGEDAVA